MPRGFESHRLRQKQHLAGCCLLFLWQTMQGLQGGIRTARARRFASRRAATVLRTVARARENPTVCAKYHYSILHWVVIFYCRFAKFRCFLIGISPLFSSSDFRVRYKSYQQSRQIAIHRTTQDSSRSLGTNRQQKGGTRYLRCRRCSNYHFFMGCASGSVSVFAIVRALRFLDCESRCA